MPRRVTLIVFLGFVAALVLTTGISAGAAPGEVRTAQAAYDAALYKMNDLNEQIADAAEDLDASEARLAEAQKSLEERASQVYKSGNVAFIDVMVGVNNFSEFAARMDLWLRLLAEERAAYDAVLEAKNELAAHKAKLEDQRAVRVAAASAEAEAEAYLASLNNELRAEIQARQEQRAQRYAELAAQAIEEQAPVEQQPTAQATAQPTAQATAQATAEAPERSAEVAAVEEAPVVPQGDTAAQQEAAAQRAAPVRDVSQTASVTKPEPPKRAAKNP